MFKFLQLVVGPNSLPDLPKSPKIGNPKSHVITSMDNIVTGFRDAYYPTGMTERGKYSCTEYVNDMEKA
jgi:hypothetical protein